MIQHLPVGPLGTEQDPFWKTVYKTQQNDIQLRCVNDIVNTSAVNSNVNTNTGAENSANKSIQDKSSSSPDEARNTLITNFTQKVEK